MCYVCFPQTNIVKGATKVTPVRLGRKGEGDDERREDRGKQSMHVDQRPSWLGIREEIVDARVLERGTARLLRLVVQDSASRREGITRRITQKNKKK